MSAATRSRPAPARRQSPDWDVLDLLRAAPPPEPPPWLGPRIMVAIAVEERHMRQRRRQRIRGRRWLALAIGLELLVFALWERTVG